jgi:hypothetical protein
MKIGTRLLTLVVASVLLMAVVATNLQQQQSASAFGFVERQQFKKLTHDFEKNVMKAIGDPNISPGPRELLNAYVKDVDRILVGDPNIDRLLQSYELDMTSLFSIPPPDGDKQLIKDFRSLTHNFEKAVIDAFTGPED